jgi:PAS domain-containing protein
MTTSVAPRAMSDSLRSLDEIRYAFDQATIVAATDHRGIITYVNDKFCHISQYSRMETMTAARIAATEAIKDQFGTHAVE